MSPSNSKWRTTPVIEEVSVEVLEVAAVAGAVDAGEAAAGAVGLEERPRTRR